MIDHAREERMAPHEPPKVAEGRVIAKIGPWGIAAVMLGWFMTMLLSAHAGAYLQRERHATEKDIGVCEARGNYPPEPRACVQKFNCSKDELHAYTRACMSTARAWKPPKG
jgi:hypothetical protein